MKTGAHAWTHTVCGRIHSHNRFTICSDKSIQFIVRFLFRFVVIKYSLEFCFKFANEWHSVSVDPGEIHLTFFNFHVIQFDRFRLLAHWCVIIPSAPVHDAFTFYDR